MEAVRWDKPLLPTLRRQRREKAEAKAAASPYGSVGFCMDSGFYIGCLSSSAVHRSRVLEGFHRIRVRFRLRALSGARVQNLGCRACRDLLK